MIVCGEGEAIIQDSSYFKNLSYLKSEKASNPNTSKLVSKLTIWKYPNILWYKPLKTGVVISLIKGSEGLL